MKYADTIISNVTMHFSWWDRVKILLRGMACVRIEIDCEIAPGEVRSSSSVSVPRLIPSSDSASGAYAEFKSPNQEQPQ